MNGNPYLGSCAQLFDVRLSTMEEGKARGTRIVDVTYGELQFTILPDRCMDLYSLRYRSQGMAFLTPAGIVHPSYHSGIGMSWHRAFGGGLLATCGLQNIGVADDTPDLTIHGRIGNTPASDFGIERDEDGLGCQIHGTMTESMLFGANLTLRRVYRQRAEENVIRFTDIIENKGYERAPVSLLYHFNLGYPLISEKAKAVIPSTEIIPRNDHAATGLSYIYDILPPTPHFEEMVYSHRVSENIVGVDNPDIDVSMRIAFTSDHLLDRVMQWKMFGQGNYVMGLEPASCTLDGRKNAIADGSQKYLEPGQICQNTFTISFAPYGGHV